MVIEQICTNLGTLIIPKKSILLTEEDVMNVNQKNNDDEPFSRNPDEATNFDIKHEIITLNNMLHAIDHRLRKISELTNSNNIKLELLEEAVAYSTYLPYLPGCPRYDHKTSQLILHRRLRIQFKGNEAELLSHIFTKSSSKPKKQRFYCAEVADGLNVIRKKYGDKTITAKSVHQTITRIRDGLELEHRAGGILQITSKDFKFIY